MNKRGMCSALCVAVATFITGSAYAAPVSYDEAVDGDIKYYHFFTFDMGTNTISGSSGTSSVFNNQDLTDFDAFGFRVSPGAQVSSVSYAFSNVTPLSGAMTGFGLKQASINGHLSDTQIDFLNDVSPVSLLAELLPLGAGIYDFSYGHWITFNGDGNLIGGTWDYILTFEVETVPEVPVPAAAWLFIAGLIGLIAISRRNKTT